MLAWLRRLAPGHPLLAVLYWVAVTAVALALLVVIFFQLDRFLPASY